ncbi:MAG: GerMN domain-containing protein [Patescibacteria group bacterium]
MFPIVSIIIALSSCSILTTQTPGTATGSTDTGSTNTGNMNQTMDIDIYFQTLRDNANLEDCGKVSRVTRTIPMTDAPATAALEQLFLGPTAQEKSDGLLDFMITDNMGDALNRVFVEDGVAYLDWDDLRQLIPSASSSCGSVGFLRPIEATLLQFPTVTKVIHAIDGQPAIFYEWIQMGCTADNDDCDASPYEMISPLPTTCTDADEGIPVITAISTRSGSLGTRVTLEGCNFSGFE